MAEEDGPLPALYLGHGAPPLFNDPLWIDQLFGWAQSLPKPRAVLIVSAHWESAPLALSASAAGTPPVYDFGGFDRRFFSMTYPTPDAGALAAQVTALLSDTESVHEHPRRGLDHGAWVPLKVMYPCRRAGAALACPRRSRIATADRGAAAPLRERESAHRVGYLTPGCPSRADTSLHPCARLVVEFDGWRRGPGDGAIAGWPTSIGPGHASAHPTVEHYRRVRHPRSAVRPDLADHRLEVPDGSGQALFQVADRHVTRRGCSSDRRA